MSRQKDDADDKTPEDLPPPRDAEDPPADDEYTPLDEDEDEAEPPVATAPVTDLSEEETTDVLDGFVEDEDEALAEARDAYVAAAEDEPAAEAETEAADEAAPADEAEPEAAAADEPAAEAAPAADESEEPPKPVEDSEAAAMAWYQNRWREIQIAFVDQPRDSVANADRLVADVIDQLANALAAERNRLASQWSEDSTSTEDLRVAFQGYRAFFERLTST